MRWLVPLAVVLFVGVALTPAAATAAPADETAVAPDAADVRPDPENDTIGWENGYWYDDPLPNVDPSDGFNESELEKVVARSMARVEQVRQLEFEQTVPVSLISRETYVERYASGDGSEAPADYRLFDNAKWEALYVVNESADSIAVRNRNQATTVGGFYSPAQERIVVVSENTETPQLNEVTLSQELFHALQDQQFNLSRLDYSTREAHNTADGVVEGDGNLVDSLYAERCSASWDCFEDTTDGEGGDGGGVPNWGRYFVVFQPYADGPAFVRQVKQRGGWAAVNELYENPPASSAAVAERQTDGGTQPAAVEIDDQTAGDWQRVRPEGRVDYAEMGQPGIAAMFVRPLYNDANPQSWVVDPRNFLNRTADGELADDPLNYSISVADGWNGDRLHVYRNADNETGYVWRINWETASDAREFADGYARLVDYYGGEAVGENTYRITDTGFADAVWVGVDDDTVTIVNAPTLDELTQVRTSAAPQTATPTPTPTEADEETDDGDATATDTGRTASPTPAAESTAARGPGLGAVVAVVALLIAGGLARRR
jgi:hypothetical protein